MKKAILIALTLLVALAAPVAHAAEPSFNVLITGGAEQNVLDIKLSQDGREYVIDSMAPLEIGGAVCTHPEAAENRLLCEAAAISGFEVNAGGGNDSATISPKIQVPVTLRGGPGNDRLYGGGGADKLVGGAGDDALYGRVGDDALYGGPGNDQLFAGSGNDVLHGGSGEDEMVGGPGENVLVP